MKTIVSILVLGMFSLPAFSQQKNSQKAQAKKTVTKKPAHKFNTKMRSNMHSKPSKGTQAQTGKSVK